MTKKLFILLVAISFATNFSGCTSKKSQNDSDIVENADVDKIDAESQQLNDSSLDAAASTAATEQALATGTEDLSLQSALGETPAADQPAPTVDTASNSDLSLDAAAAPDVQTDATANAEPVATPPVDVAAAAPTLDESSLNDIPAPTDMNAGSSLTETPIAADSTAPSVDTSLDAIAPPSSSTPMASSALAETAPLIESNMASSSNDEPAPAPKPAGSSLKKVALTAPYQAGTGWVNTVYIARSGEKLKDISMKIFGSDKSKDLKKITENSYLKARSVKMGDKVYYVSPNRPDDSTKTLTYFEDTGMVPEMYTAKKGDRLKKVAKNLLGNEKGWIELWATNSIESKDKLQEGDSLRYWRSSSSISAPTMAQNTPPPVDPAMPHMTEPSAMTPPPADMAQNTPPPPDMNTLPPPPPADPAMQAPPQPTMAQNTPPPVDPAMQGAPPPPPPMDPPPPPPADPAMQAPPPPPDAMDNKAKKFNPPNEHGEEATSDNPLGALDEDTMMSLGAVGVLTIALAVVLIRRRKKKAAEQAMTEHDVGT